MQCHSHGQMSTKVGMNTSGRRYGGKCMIFGEPVNVINGVKYGLAERILQEALDSTESVNF